jgi:hypothetical protein
MDLLFKFKEKGLYTQNFARVNGFPKTNLSHAYLMGVDFKGAQCQKANFANICKALIQKIRKNAIIKNIRTSAISCEIFCRLFFGGYIIAALKIIISVATTLKRELIFVGILTASLNR